MGKLKNKTAPMSGRRARRALIVGFLCGLGLFAASCASSTYYLPPPPDQQKSAKKSDAGPKSNAERAPEELDAQAREALMELYELLEHERFEEAEDYLSQETREFLSHAGAEEDASETLSSGQIQLAGRSPIKISPVKLLIGGNIESVRDAMEGVSENQTPNRRELFVLDPAGDTHRVIMIFEGGKWVLHKTSIQPE